MVYVDLQGRTDRRWVELPTHVFDGIAAMLANTGLDVVPARRVIDSNDFAGSMIDVGSRLGAWGWAFN